MSKVMGHPPRTGRVGVLRLQGEYRLLAIETIEEGELLFPIEGEQTPVPSRYSVQVGEDCHVDLSDRHALEDVLDQYFWRFMNHHCEPNCVIQDQAVYALRRIHPWEEIAFNYNTTEYEMAEPFVCRCGSHRCHQRIQGFKYLSETEQELLRPWLASHLLRHLDVTQVDVTHAVVSERAVPERREGSAAF